MVVNVQGDLPTIDPHVIAECITPLADPAVDIATLVATITREEEKTAPSVVKLVGSAVGPGRMRALYFTRATAPWGEGPLFHHIGLYAYRRRSLERFVRLPPSPLEMREKLEQLRALEAGMRIDATLVDTVPLGVDTPEDLERARAMLSGAGEA
jgi:3-deoxy-manno-octulosonate cytidylyltransferase (CMP-KDO synthetase)